MLDFDLTPEDLDYTSRIHASQFPHFVAEYLRDIRESALSTNVSSESIFMCQVLVDYAWEALNTNIWVFVEDKWRLLYAFATLYKILCMRGVNADMDGDRIVELCDLGLLMSGPLLEKQFDQIIKYVNRSKTSKRIKLNPPLEEATQSLAPSQVVLKKEFELIVEDSPSVEHFEACYLRPHVPCIIDNQMSHWPALKKWSLDYIEELAGNRTVPIEIGSKYTDTDWSQRLMTIKEFIKRFVQVDDFDSTKGYLAQHPLFDQIPELKEDIYVPEYCVYLGEGAEESEVDINAWFGPAGTVSPLHFDPKNNFLCQVIGEKYVRLYAEEHTERLYAHEGNILRNTSRIDVERLDLVRFPLAEQVPYWEGVLRPGQMLFIPARCWHFVRSLSLSFSVSFWWN